MAGRELYPDLFGSRTALSSRRGRPRSTRRCTADGCQRRGAVRGLCTQHYVRWWRSGDFDYHPRIPRDESVLPEWTDKARCRVDGCLKEPWRGKLGLCCKHYTRWYKHGDPLKTLHRTARGEGKGAKAVCPGCNSVFIRRTAKSKYCNHACSVKHKRQLSRKIRTCQGCGQEFWNPNRRGQVTFCSRGCYFKAIGSHVASERERNRWMNTRAKQAGIMPYETIDRQKVYERDSWRCQLCGKRIPKDKCHPHPLSPSIDHIIPFEAGGSHTYDNVQAAHFRCNSKRQHLGPAQLIMFGGLHANATG